MARRERLWISLLFALLGSVTGFTTTRTRTGLVAVPSTRVVPSRTTTTRTTTTRLQDFLSPIPTNPIALAPNAIGKKVLKKSIVKGKVSGLVAKLFISPRQWAHVAQKLVSAIEKDFWDIVLIISVYKFIVPLAQRLYRRRNPHQGDAEKFNILFQRSKTNRIARAIKEVAGLVGLLFAFDIGLVLLDELDFDFVRQYPLHQWTAGIVASLWGSRNLSEFKDFVITSGNRIDLVQSPGRQLLSRFLNLLIYGSTILVILDFLSVQTGFALKSLFGLSSVGTLVFSLASKELVSEFLASLAIQGTNMYTEGERILLSDGTTGTVQKLGWLNTHLRRGDELVIRIPNTQISGTRVANISRSRLSTVKQALAISYDDVDKLPQLIVDIKKEIREVCPTLIDDGSRSFQVFFSDYKDFSVEVLVSAHFRTKPFSDAYYEVKQDVLMAIRRATIKNNVKFSYVNFLPSTVPFLD